jgi:hypothetical protein
MSSKIDTKLGRRGFLKGVLRRARRTNVLQPLQLNEALGRIMILPFEYVRAPVSRRRSHGIHLTS